MICIYINHVILGWLWVKYVNTKLINLLIVLRCVYFQPDFDTKSFTLNNKLQKIILCSWAVSNIMTPIYYISPAHNYNIQQMSNRTWRSHVGLGYFFNNCFYQMNWRMRRKKKLLRTSQSNYLKRIFFLFGGSSITLESTLYNTLLWWAYMCDIMSYINNERRVLYNI